MSNIVQRNLQRSLAKSVSDLVEETGLPQGQIIEILNNEYGYVTQNDPELLTDLNKQIGLDTAANLHAKQKKVKVNEVAVVKTIYDRKTHQLAKIVRNKNVEYKI